MGLVETLRGLSDAELLLSLRRVVAAERRSTAELLVHLTEVELRRLYLDASCSSLFVYCTERLGLDGGAAYTRIRAARVARQFPVVLRMVADGRLHLAGIGLLAGHLTEDNHCELLAAASGRSKRAIEALLAERAPKPSVPATIRRLPDRARPAAQQSPLDLGASPTSLAPARPAAGIVGPPSTGPTPSGELQDPASVGAQVGELAAASERHDSTQDGAPVGELAAATERHDSTQVGAPTAPSARQDAPHIADLGVPTEGSNATQGAPAAPKVAAEPESTRDRSPGAPGQAGAPSNGRAAQRRRGVVEPLGAHRHRIELTASDALVGKLERALALLSHKLPGGDIADVIEQALTLLVETLEKKRYGARRKVGRAGQRRSGAPRAAEATGQPGATEPQQAAAPGAPAERDDAPPAHAAEGPGHRNGSGAEASAPAQQAAVAGAPGDRDDNGPTCPPIVEVARGVEATDPQVEDGPAAPGAAPSVPRASSPSGRGPRRVPMGVRREVYERDGARCTHVDAEGRRCTETRKLELDHIEPWARGGPSNVHNLRLLCAAHNGHAARKEFGPAFIARRIERRIDRRTSGPPG